ncbi:hypothetical protein BOTBODRAFT_248433 [Botryobasidium botryosum FD-172 SS1]|uniref:Uncharacterized protein n=1 Tax=Botryobasidium botryosum (strain FD-172 SS1) TaxID=930990 RepID=A0A067MX29_BOTB1|nr:hypothetical protein BOTBODRAFT_248433 [Botryobasidium botryosum FD-172 SS1]
MSTNSVVPQLRLEQPELLSVYRRLYSAMHQWLPIVISDYAEPSDPHITDPSTGELSPEQGKRRRSTGTTINPRESLLTAGWTACTLFLFPLPRPNAQCISYLSLKLLISRGWHSLWTSCQPRPPSRTPCR